MSETADEDLTGLLDGRLPDPERTDLLRRIAEDPLLERRLRDLAQARGEIDAAFAAMLAQAPVARLRAALPGEAPRPRFAAMAYARLAAGLAIIAVLSAALAAWLTFKVTSEPEDWVTAVVEYMQLYTPETFAGLKPDATQEAANIAKVGARLGIDVTAPELAAPGLGFKTAFVLSYEGAPLGEFVFTDSAGIPYLFCVWDRGSGPAPLHWDERRPYEVAVWGRSGKQFVVIGPSAQIIRDWSQALAGRV